jgi:Nuclease-related domain
MEKRSPLKEKPLRNPGQSVEEQLQDRLIDKLLQPILIAWLLIVLAGAEWWRAWSNHPPQPWLFSFVALVGVASAGYVIWKAAPGIRALRQARDGEKAVGQFLERLREQGYRVFHDVMGPGFNVDHVLIGPAGVFTIETKTYSRPVGTNAKIRFDGGTLSVDGVKVDRDPVVQAKAQAGWLRNLLEESTGKIFSVRPVVLFPGWFIEQTKEGSTREVWVLNPKAFPKFLSNEPAVLDVESVSQASLHLSRVVRTT